MAQHDYNIANQSFPSFRTDLNNVLSAINTSNSGTSRPSGAVVGTIWLDTTSATTPTLKYYDGADDISLATLDHCANTVNWLDNSVSFDIVNDTTPQLGGDLDPNSNKIAGSLLPSTDDTYDLGSASFQWANIYTGDLHLSNESKAEGNIVDGTTGNWTIQEGSDDLFIVNNKSIFSPYLRGNCCDLKMTKRLEKPPFDSLFLSETSNRVYHRKREKQRKRKYKSRN